MEPLAGLSTEYQILTELHRSGETVTYLARHLELQRDVTITVARATGDRSYLNAFANDVEVLKNQRHPNIVPVVEGRWIDADSYAVVRARVRGSTLDGLLSAVGAMPAPRVQAALREIATAIAFARDAGIVNRFVSPESLVFQQGTGRALIAFEPSRLVADDAQTIRELALAMNGGAPMDVSEYIALLGAPAVPVAAAATVPVAAPVTPPSTAPVGARPVADDAVVVVKRSGMGFGARLVTAFVVLALLVGAAVFFWPRRAHDVSRTASTAMPDTQGDAAGDVALRSNNSPVDAQVYPTPVIVEPTPTPTPPPPTSSYPYPYPSYPQQTPTIVPSRPAPPVTQPSQPVQPAEPVAPQPKPEPTDTVVRRPTDVCDSPDSGDQRQCLLAAIDRNDRGLNSAYQRLITALRRQAGVSDSDPDPSSVEELRSAQRRWLEDRDEVCRGTGSGLLYARERAQCFADRSAQRARELEAQLAAIP